MESVPVSAFQTNPTKIEGETKFYRESEAVLRDIAAFRERLNAQTAEFDLLFEYYLRHRGKIDVYHHAQNGPLAARPNLGTDDEAWYYLDASGNKIWVRNLLLDTSDPNCGAFVNQKNADGRVVVVTVPKAKQNYALQPDYHKKCMEYDAYMSSTAGERPWSSSMRRRTQLHAQPSSGLGAPEGGVEHYINGQKEFGDALRRSMIAADTRVFRPPTSIEEAERRLAELKAEEQRLRVTL